MQERNERIAVIGDRTMLTGFRLSGISKYFELDGDAAIEKLKELLSAENIGIIVISERTLAQADWRLKHRIESIAKPIVVAVPDRFGSSAEAESLAERIKRALGFDLVSVKN